MLSQELLNRLQELYEKCECEEEDEKKDDDDTEEDDEEREDSDPEDDKIISKMKKENIDLFNQISSQITEDHNKFFDLTNKLISVTNLLFESYARQFALMGNNLDEEDSLREDFINLSSDCNESLNFGEELQLNMELTEQDASLSSFVFGILEKVDKMNQIYDSAHSAFLNELDSGKVLEKND